MKSMKSAYRWVFVIGAAAVGLGVYAGIVEGAAPYGPPIPLETAKILMAAAEKEAAANGWEVAIAIVDSGSNLVMLHRLDNTQLGSLELCVKKAKTAVDFRRSTKVFQDRLGEGGVNLKLLQLNGLSMEGGLPIIRDGEIIGGIGVSGVTSAQDGMVGAAALKALE